MKKVVLWGVLASMLACGDDDDTGQRDDAAIEQDGSRPGPRPDASAHDAGKLDAAAPKDAGHDTIEPRVDASPKDAASDAGQDAGDASTIDADLPRSHGLEAREDNISCFVDGTPPLAIVPIAEQATYAQLDTTGAVAVTRAPARRLAVVERTGRVLGFSADGDGSDAAALADFSAAIRSDGLRGAAFSEDGSRFVASYVPVDDPLRLVVSRFAVSNDGMPDLGSEDPLITVPLTVQARAGGALAFLFDGTLAIAIGDGGDAVAAADVAQLAGKVVRIDINGTSGYAIPSDNPFDDDDPERDEIYALGLLAPSSCTVDRITGRLWCADNGHDTNDFILLVRPGMTLLPVVSLPRTDCGVIVGFVSRDAALPDIQGSLVFGDTCSDTVHALRFDGALVRSQAAIVTLDAAPLAFGEHADGRMFALDANGASHALVRPGSAAPPFPSTVSDTGCLADMTTRAPAPGLIPYEVRAPLWSDGASKHRYMVLPAQETIGFTETGAWQFPVGAMFIKEFALDDDQDPGTPERILETRYLIKRSDVSWEGYSYMWDREQKDGFLLEGAEIGRYAMQPGAVNAGGDSVHAHTFPDRTQCLLCHNLATGRALGLQTGRMNTDHDYDGFVENQLQAMAYVGLFSEPLPAAPDALPRFPEPSDEGAELEGRARAWLYANCAHCHQPGGPTPVDLDFRFETPLADTHTCGLTPRFEIAQLPEAKIIDPSHADNSELFFRMSRRDPNQMPPIATMITDPVGVEVVQQWIDSLQACP